MAKVGLFLSRTVNIGNSEQFMRVGGEVSEINTDIPLKLQLEEAQKSSKEIFKLIVEQIDAEIEEIVDKNNG